jgi:hypothetical protein
MMRRIGKQALGSGQLYVQARVITYVALEICLKYQNIKLCGSFTSVPILLLFALLS